MVDRALGKWLERAEIGYPHLAGLGGRRPAQKVEDVTRIAGWKTAGSKNYAECTMTHPYQHEIEQLIAPASGNQVAYLCGEPIPWRCRRLIISNTLVERGWTVRHTLGDAEPRVHVLGKWRATPIPDGNGVLTYPADIASG